jgi:AraC-like DNA-binding protein
MQYLESSPSPDLRRFIKCFWSLEQTAVETSNSREPVLPDGRVEIVFNLADRFHRYHSTTDFELQPSSLVAGQMTRNVLIGPSGGVSLFGVRFQPTGAYYFFGFPMSELTDRIESFDALFKVSDLDDRLRNATDLHQRIAIFEEAMRMNLANAGAVDPKLEDSVRKIAAMAEQRSIANVASTLGWSERKLERDFKKYVGVSPKLFSRIDRFASIVRALETTGPSKLTEHAHRFGYYDQSHMINEFRGFAGESPTAFYERTHRMSALFTVGG